MEQNDISAFENLIDTSVTKMKSKAASIISSTKSAPKNTPMTATISPDVTVLSNIELPDKIKARGSIDGIEKRKRFDS